MEEGMKKKQVTNDTPTAGTTPALTVEQAEAFMHDACSEFVRAHKEWSDFKCDKPSRTLIVHVTDGIHFRVLSYSEDIQP